MRFNCAGGAGLYSFDLGTIKPNSEVRKDHTYGDLKLTLHPTSYDWQFIPVAGRIFTDSGSTGCHYTNESLRWPISLFRKAKKAHAVPV